MRTVKVGAAVLNQTALDWGTNRRHIVEAIALAQQEKAAVLCLPELCITGYGCEDAFHSVSVQQRALSTLLEIVELTADIAVVVGLPVLHRGGLFNAAAFLVDRKLLGFTAKHTLPNEGIHYEPRWFKPWPLGLRGEIESAEGSFPIGDYLFQLGDVRVGLEICEEAWSAQRIGASLAAAGADIILNPSASHFAFGKQQIRERIVLEGSRAFGVAYVYTNLVGNEAGRIVYDGSAMIAASGRMLAQARRFSHRDVSLITAVIDLDNLRRTRMQSAATAAETPPSVAVLRCSFSPPDAEIRRSSEAATWEGTKLQKHEEFARAVALGLFDYLRKSRARGFVVSLSGGADSSAVSCLAALSIHFAAAEIGLGGLKHALQHVSDIAAADSPAAVVHSLLTCVYQSTEHSSETTRAAAREVAAALRARFLELDVSTFVNGYLRAVTDALGLTQNISWESDDVALQNIQARVRGPGVWLIANLKQALLLATSNRSEAAVGYTTMDGDTCGSLSPIGGIDKAYLREWLKWLQTEGPSDFGPLPALMLVNAQQPTAELRPPSACQTDEDDLMPYPVLDAIERLAIRDKKSPLEVVRSLGGELPTYSRETLAGWVEKFFRLWCRNQWKRERYAPSFHLDDENLDPKTWCRFPILSGNFEEELAELRSSLCRL